MTLEIGEPSLSDVPGLLSLIQEHAAYERSVASLTADELEALLMARPVHFLTAWLGRAVVGYAALTFDWSVWRARRYAHLDCLFVSASHRGHGIGRLLLAEARVVALAESVDRMEWQTPDWNEDASRFYLREGASRQKKARFRLLLP